MRIVSGALRGRPLVAPKGHSTRPTSERTRQAVFNVLQHAAWAPDLEGARVIDLFAGSGAMGLEALSRGAAFARFVERDDPAVAALRANLASLSLTDRAAIDRRDANRLGAHAPGAPAFDLAFVDPPYGDAVDDALAGLLSGGWLAKSALIVLERNRRDAGHPPPGYVRIDERAWGAARVSFLKPSTSA